MKPQIFTIKDKSTVRQLMTNAYNSVLSRLEFGPVIVTLSEETRTVQQNSKMWPLLNDIATQKLWDGTKLDTESWKCLCMEACSKVYWGNNGEMVRTHDKKGFIYLNYSTKNLSKKKFSQLIETIYGIGAELGVVFSEKSVDIYDQYKLKPEK